ncbi:MAG TPA: hypothetical protein VHU43_00550 [Steroidobacteraceae bacterium]|nr:hypothetical protein [Steroidobacteraceae bacterium]
MGLSTRLDLAEEVRSLARKHHVRIEEFKIAGLHDVLDALKTMPAATEQKCVAACRAAITVDPGAGDLYTPLRRTSLENMERHLKSGGVTLAVVSMDMLIQPGGFLDELRERGYTVDPP